MAKLFGEFLIDKNIVSTEQVLEAVVVQLRSVSSTAEVIFDHDLLPKVEQLRILSHQQYAGLDFRASAQSLGLWNDTLAGKVSNLLMEKRQPLGEVLVALGFINIQSLTDALDAYVELYSSSKKIEVAADPEPKRAITFNSILCDEFVANFESRIGPSLQNIMMQFDSSSLGREALVTKLNSINVEIVGLRAAANFLAATHCERLATDMILSIENSLHAILSQGAHPDSKTLHEVFSFFYRAMQSFCKYLKEFCNEECVDTDPNLKDILQRLSKAQETLQTQNSLGSVGLNIAIIDDSKAVHAFIEEVFEGKNVTLTHFYDGQEGINAMDALKSKLDLILLDWEMPVLNGIDALPQLVAKMQVPVMMMTSKNTLSDITLALERGASDYIMKPFTKDILASKIEQVAGRKVL